MEAPLHQICGTRHWSSQPCPAMKNDNKEADVPTAAATKIANSPKGGKRARPAPKAKTGAGKTTRRSVKPAPKPKAPKRPSKVVAKKGDPVKRPAHRPRETEEGFDKQKWQREYMRKYRARMKAEREATAGKPYAGKEKKAAKK